MQNWNPSTCICENGKYLKNIADTSVIVCDKIINVTDSLSTNVTNTMPLNMTNTISTNDVTSTVSINIDDKKVRYKMDCYTCHKFLLVIKILFITVIICDHYTKDRSKQKYTDALTV